MDRVSIWFGTDGDYAIRERLWEGRWYPISSWLIPNSQIED